MALIMAYATLLAAAVAGCAAVAELLVRRRRVPGRWIWVTALVFSVAATLVAMFAPVPPASTVSGMVPVMTTVAVGGQRLMESSVAPAPRRFPTATAIARANASLRVLWLSASAVLLLAIGVGQLHLARERRRARMIDLQGHQVLLTEHLGPAVAGIRSPLIIVPRWVLALDEPSQRLLLAHEAEHVRCRDTRLLLGGATMAALMPWNPVVWWMVSRLRLALEQDCDDRVLKSHPDVKQYAKLLLTAASRPRISTRLLAAHFGEERTDLSRRIEAMTNRTLKGRRVVSTVTATAVLVLVSCEAPRPEPLAPRVAAEKPSPAINHEDVVLYEHQVEKAAKITAGSVMPRYPEILRQAGVEGETFVTFVVDEKGRADTSTLKVIRSTHELFTTAVRRALVEMRFEPAVLGGVSVKQLIREPFTFTLSGRSQQKRDRSQSQNDDNVVLYHLRAPDATDTVPSRVVVLSSYGAELGRFASPDHAMGSITLFGVESIKEQKTGDCSPLPCPLTRITLKKGFRLMNYAEWKKAEQVR